MNCYVFSLSRIPLFASARSLFLIAGLIFGNACQNQSNKLDEIKLQCGSEVSSANLNGVILKFLADPGVESLDSKNLQVVALEENGTPSNPTVTSRGCVIVPSTTASVRARSNIDGQSLTLATKLSGSSNTNVQHLNLLPSPQVTADFLCPVEGIFGHDSVKLPLRVEIDGKFENIGFEVLAKNTVSGATSVLVRKRFGDPNRAFSEIINIANLPEGSYELSLAEARMEDSLEELFKINSSQSTCALTKVGAMPFLTNNSESTVIRRGDPVLVAPRDLKIRSCSIDLKDLTQEERESESCHYQRACLDPANFTTNDKVIADKPGSYRFYYQLEDRLGQRSNLICQDSIISEVAPAISIQWEDAKLNLAPTSLDLPYTKIALRIKTSHPSLNHEQIKNNQLCSATISTSPLISIPAKVFTCMSEECLGKTLDQPVPCGERLEIDLTRFYEIQELWDATVIVKTTTTDGTGLTSEAETGLFFHSSMWKATEEREALQLQAFPGEKLGDYFVPDAPRLPAYNLKQIETDKGRVGVYLTYVDGTPLILQGPHEESSAYSYTRSTNNISYVLWSDRSIRGCTIFSYDSLGRKLESIQLPEDEGDSCSLTISIGNDNSLWLFSAESTSLYYYVLIDGEWKKKSPPTPNDQYCLSFGSNPFRALDKDHFILNCYDSKGQNFLASHLNSSFTYEMAEKGQEFGPNPIPEPYSCNNDRITFTIEGREIYYPWIKILKKAVLLNKDLEGIVQFECDYITRSADSILYPVGRYLYKINPSTKRVLHTAHLPLGLTVSAVTRKIQGDQIVYGLSNSDLLSHNRSIQPVPDVLFFYLKNYRYLPLKLPQIDQAQALADSITSDRFPGAGINRNGSLYFRVGSQAWILDKSGSWSRTEDQTLLIESSDLTNEFTFDYPWDVELAAEGASGFYDLAPKVEPAP